MQICRLGEVSPPVGGDLEVTVIWGEGWWTGFGWGGLKLGHLEQKHMNQLWPINPAILPWLGPPVLLLVTSIHPDSRGATSFSAHTHGGAATRLRVSTPLTHRAEGVVGPEGSVLS